MIGKYGLNAQPVNAYVAVNCWLITHLPVSIQAKSLQCSGKAYGAWFVLCCLPGYVFHVYLGQCSSFNASAGTLFVMCVLNGS